MGTLKAAISKNIRLVRKKLGLSQATLADKASLSPRYISALEQGTANVSVDTVEKIANALGEKPDRLIVDAETHPSVATIPLIDQCIEVLHKLRNYIKKETHSISPQQENT